MIQKLNISDGHLQRAVENAAKSIVMRGGIPYPPPDGLKLPELPTGVVPTKFKQAMDSAGGQAIEWASGQNMGGIYGFLGYPFLSELFQIQEFRALCEAPAGEMVRKWAKLTTTGQGDKSKRIAKIEAIMRRTKIRRRFQEAAIYDDGFGRAQLYIDLGPISDEERQTPLLDVAAKIKRKSFRGLKLIEPVVTSPYHYNSTDPTADNYFNPQKWFLLGKLTHATRLLPFVSRPVPDLLKPAYNFGGMSMSQLALDCVRNWREVRDSVTRMVKSYSVSGIRTSMQDVLTGGSATQLERRAAFFNIYRDNFNTLLLDKDSEEFFQFNAPIAGLDKLQAQAQEHMAAVGRIPLVVLLGVTPSGLNASSEGELQTFYDYIKERQELTFRDNLERVVRIIQLSEFGDVDPDIAIEFEPLWQMDDEAMARIRKSDADAAQIYVDLSVVDNLDVRKKLATDPNSGYQGLDIGSGEASVLDPEEEDPEPDAPAPGAAPAAPAKPATPAKAPDKVRGKVGSARAIRR